MQDALRSTFYLDCNHPDIRDLAAELTAGLEQPAGRAAALFRHVRDQIRYTVHAAFADPTAYPASVTLRRGDGYCIQKSVLLAALLRAAGIPARLHFADLRNRRAPEELRALMGTDVFYFHGYVEAHVEGAWRKATPAFDRGTCERHGIRRVQWDGRSDALLHATDVHGRPHFEYLADRGPRDDLPLDDIIAMLLGKYPQYDGSAWGAAFKE